MLHMLAVYGASQLFKHPSWWHGRLALYCLGYYGMVFALTFLLAHLSYRYFEQPFLRLKDRRFSRPSPAPPAPPAPPLGPGPPGPPPVPPPTPPRQGAGRG